MNNQQHPPILWLTLTSLGPLVLYSLAIVLSWLGESWVNWMTVTPLIGTALFFYFRLTAKWGNHPGPGNALYILLLIALVAEIIFCWSLTESFSLVLFILCVATAIPSTLIVFYGPKAGNAFDFRQKASRQTLFLSVVLLVGVIMGIKLSIQGVNYSSKLVRFVSLDPKMPVPSLMLSGIMMGVAVFRGVIIENFSLDRWWSDSTLSTQALWAGIRETIRLEASRPMPEGLEKLAQLRRKLPVNALFLSVNDAAILHQAWAEIDAAEQRYLKFQPTLQPGDPLPVCTDCTRRAQPQKRGNRIIYECPSCRNFRNLLPGIAQIHAVIGVGGTENNPNSLSKPIWDFARKEIHPMDLDVLLLAEGEEALDFDFAIAALRAWWENQNQAQKPLLQIEGKPRLSENTLRILRDFVANPEVLDSLDSPHGNERIA